MALMENVQEEERKSDSDTEQRSVARSIGERIAVCRKAIREDQKELARRLGVKPSTMNRWETGYTPISVYDLMRVAQALKRPASWFLAAELPEEAEVHDLRLQQDYRSLTLAHQGVLLTLLQALLRLQDGAGEAGCPAAELERESGQSKIADLPGSQTRLEVERSDTAG